MISIPLSTTLTAGFSTLCSRSCTIFFIQPQWTLASPRHSTRHLNIASALCMKLWVTGLLILGELVCFVTHWLRNLNKAFALNEWFLYTWRAYILCNSLVKKELSNRGTSIFNSFKGIHSASKHWLYWRNLQITIFFYLCVCLSHAGIGLCVSCVSGWQWKKEESLNKLPYSLLKLKRIHRNKKDYGCVSKVCVKDNVGIE